MKKARDERGFTLIELMVVMIIIGILVAIAVPVMSNQADKAKVKRVEAELKSMKTIMDVYLNDTLDNDDGKAPDTAADAKIVLSKGGVNVFDDPWGTSYYYKKDGDTEYTIYSCGSDKGEGGSNDISVTNADNPQENQDCSGGDPLD